MSAPISSFSQTILTEKYSHVKSNGEKETWEEICRRVVTSVMAAVNAPTDLVEEIITVMVARKLLAGGRYLHSAGLQYHQVNNCFLMRAEDSREGWAELLRKVALVSMSGGGCGIDYSLVRASGKIIRKTGGITTGPTALMQMVNEAGRGIMGGGSRRAALWAGLAWKHADVNRFIHLKDWPQEVRDLKEKDFSFPATLDLTNISIMLDSQFFNAYNKGSHSLNSLAHSVYWNSIRRALKTGEPGFSVTSDGEDLRNPCTEITSEDDSDVCCLASINIAQIESLGEMRHVMDMALAFLVAGTVYSDTPYSQISLVREKNRRLGLGLMGLHEWLLIHSKKYGPDPDLEGYLREYAQSTEVAAKWADKWDLSHPKKTRAIAPTGTISIIAETSSGIEPIFCVSYKRRYLKGSLWNCQYVIDPVAKRLVEAGIRPETIEDSYTLAEDIERRLAFQAWVQEYVDHAISSTINLPAWGSAVNNEDKVTEIGQVILKYLPKLKGLTVYPEGARGGQPLVPVQYATALKHVGEVFVEGSNVCSITGKGSCGE